MDILSTALAGFLSRPRWAKSPIPLYRRGLGWVFGHRMLMLEHVGRTSGRPRYVVLEVVDHPAKDRYLIASGFGRNAQWYRNLAANPRCAVSVGRRRNVPASARLLDADESARELRDYQRRHPRLWEGLRTAIVKMTDGPVEILMVELQLGSAA